MIYFFKDPLQITAVDASDPLSKEDKSKLTWLFSQATFLDKENISGYFLGPRPEMITPWSTNAVEITQITGIKGIRRIEIFTPTEKQAPFDPMLQHQYNGLDQNIFTIDGTPQIVFPVDDIAAYNEQQGLALSKEEIGYLEALSKRIGRKLTDSEVFGFSQVNSEHCRHKIFNGTFILDGYSMPASLFSLIKKTSRINHHNLVSAYKDNVAFIKGPPIDLFSPDSHDSAQFFALRRISSVISLKAETHNFPTTVEPFSGAATGSGGEIRDRMAGGKASMPLAGTAVYMTPYPRLEKSRPYEEAVKPRKWLYHDPKTILIKASDGASDYGNKFGQPLICGSVLTFEHEENEQTLAYDKVVMLAGGVGYAKEEDSMKDTPEKGDIIVVLGGDNYRIGMGGSSVSSVATGEYGNNLELNAVQRSNPEMQKRVYNVIRAMGESKTNPVIAIHDHGAGGHLNSLSELVEDAGGVIDIRKLPLGDPTLSAKEIIGNESQERMGLIIKKKNLATLERIAKRERAPIYVVGTVTGDHRFVMRQDPSQKAAIDLEIKDLFGDPPQTIMRDVSVPVRYKPVSYKKASLEECLENVLKLEAVACKDWLTNKVDRSVTGRIAMQQTCGPLQLPLNNLGIATLDYSGTKGAATAIGHAPAAGLINAEKGAVLSIAEALTNLIWAPLTNGIKGVSLSANWMWPANNKGEDARLYKAVEAASNFAIDLGINIPTGKDSLSMKQKYPGKKEVLSPGTVIITAVAEAEELKKTITPVLHNKPGTKILHVDFSKYLPNLGGSSLAQTLNQLGDTSPTVEDPVYFKRAFQCVQQMIRKELILAGHDISAGGMITALLEMAFTCPGAGLEAHTSCLLSTNPVNALFCENPGILIQVEDDQRAKRILNKMSISFNEIAVVNQSKRLTIKHHEAFFDLNINKLFQTWMKTSLLMDQEQSGKKLASIRYNNIINHALSFQFPQNFNGRYENLFIDPARQERSGIGAAIIREKGVNGDREMAWSLHLAGFDVKDIHMTDLISGEETLEDVQMIVFVGGFSNSDVLGSAKGWAGAFRYNQKAGKALKMFYERKDTLSLGICNGCQLMNELGLLYPDHKQHPANKHNDSGKFESAFINVTIEKSPAIMLQGLEGSRLGVWVAHGEGKFYFPSDESQYIIPIKYAHSTYPANPNGSPHDAAALASPDGRHLAMMPHLERAIIPWQWAYYPENRQHEQLSPWIMAFTNALNWIKSAP